MSKHYTSERTFMIERYIRYCLIFLSLFIVNTGRLLADFGPPVNVSVPSTGNALELSIATDPTGDTVAVWTEQSGSDVIVRSSFLPLNGTWTSPQSLTISGTATVPKVVIDDNGNAYASWQIGSSVQAAYTPFNGVWSQFFSDTGDQPDIAVNTATGDAVLVYHIQNGSQHTIKSALFTIATGWHNTANASSTLTSAMSFPKVAINTSGQIFCAWNFLVFGNWVSSSFGTISGTSISWGGDVVALSVPTTTFPSVFINPTTGDGTIVTLATILSQIEVYTITMFNGGSSTGSNAISSPGSSFSRPATAVDSQGNGIALWVQDGLLLFSRYDPSNQTWSTPQIIPTAGLPAGPVDVAFDINGNAWGTWPTTVGGIEVAYLPVGSNTWQDLQVVVPSGTAVPVVGAATNGAVLAWIASSSSFNIVQSAVSGFPPPPPPPPSTQPLPPSSFSGQPIKVKFLAVTEYVNKLTWGASQDPTVVGYRIYRNGVLINTVSVNQLSYEDHNRPKHGSDAYFITSFNVSGIESIALSIIL